MKAYIARDSDGNLFIYNEKPEKGGYCWWCRSDFLPIKEEDLPQGVNPSWEDEEPIEVNVNITKASDDVTTISKDRYEQLLQYEQEYKQRQSMINSLFIKQARV